MGWTNTIAVLVTSTTTATAIATGVTSSAGTSLPISGCTGRHLAASQDRSHAYPDWALVAPGMLTPHVYDERSILGYDTDRYMYILSAPTLRVETHNMHTCTTHTHPPHGTRARHPQLGASRSHPAIPLVIISARCTVYSLGPPADVYVQRYDAHIRRYDARYGATMRIRRYDAHTALRCAIQRYDARTYGATMRGVSATTRV